MRMNLEELKKWISESEVEARDGDYDLNGDYDGWIVLRHDGKLYRLETYGDRGEYYSSVWEDDHILKGIYEPQEVIKHKYVVEQVEYLPVSKDVENVKNVEQVTSNE